MVDAPLTSWVSARLAEGWTTEQVYLELLKQGHTVEVIQRAFHDAGRETRSADLQQRVVRIVLIIGAVLVGAGVFSFIAANWSAMPDWLRIGLIVTGIVVFAVSGWVVKEFTSLKLTGAALIFVGSAIYGAGIYLVAQIYNIQGNWPDGFMLWMIGVLAMAAATRTTSLYVGGLILGIISAIGYPIGLLGDGGLDPYLLSSPVFIALGCIAALAAGFLLRWRAHFGPEDRW